MSKTFNKNQLAGLEEIAKELRREIVTMHALSGNSHIGSSLSVVEILIALYFYSLDLSPGCRGKKKDRLIFSKGHASSSLYAVLAKKGFFSKDLLKSYCVDGTKLAGHCIINCVPGIEASTGSLGHGLSMGAGLAIGMRAEREKHRAFVILSDGECQEGSVWEAAMFASQHKLDNLVAIIDYNKLQAFGKTSEVMDLEPLSKKWFSFGWEAREINGHNLPQVIKALSEAPFKKDKPSVIIAHTVKGKGISFMENQLLWHYKSPNKDELRKALRELD